MHSAFTSTKYKVNHINQKISSFIALIFIHISDFLTYHVDEEEDYVYSMYWLTFKQYSLLNPNEVLKKQAEKLKSRKMKEGWMKNDEGWKMNDEEWWFQVVEGVCFMTDEQMNERTDGQTFAIVELLSRLKTPEEAPQKQKT